MARHSHWHQIRQKKGLEDKKRGKIFTRHAKLIALAVQKGGSDPSMNPTLRMAVENARADNLPKDNIERAIKKGLGEDKASVQFSEITYEGFGPGGTAFMIEAITDNKNRTLQSVRMILEEYGGRLGNAGSVSYLFQQKGIIFVKETDNPEDDELKLIDAGADDLNAQENEWTVFCAPSKLAEVKRKIEESGFSVLSAELSFEPKNATKIENRETTQKLIDLIDALESEEDVTRVYTNVDV